MLQVRWPRTNGTAVTFSKIQRERKKGRARISEEKEKERANSKEKIISKVQKTKGKERKSLGLRTRMGILRRSRMGVFRLDDSGVVTTSGGNAASGFIRFIDQCRTINSNMFTSNDAKSRHSIQNTCISCPYSFTESLLSGD